MVLSYVIKIDIISRKKQGLLWNKNYLKGDKIMDKNVLTYIVGVTFVGAVGMCTTWWAGRSSYKQGVIDGVSFTKALYELSEKLNKSKKIES